MDGIRPHALPSFAPLIWLFIVFEGNEYMQGDGHNGDHAMGDEDAQGSEVDPDDEHYTGYVANGAHDAAGHPLVNGTGHADAPSGSQEHQEGGAVPVAPSQANENENSQDHVSSTPPLQAPNGSVPPDASSSATLVDTLSQSAGPNTEVSQSVPATPRPAPLQATDSMTTVADTELEAETGVVGTVAGIVETAKQVAVNMVEALAPGTTETPLETPAPEVCCHLPKGMYHTILS